MDPDSIGWIMSIAGAAVSIAAIYFIGVDAANEPDDNTPAPIGFTDRAAGLYAAFVFGCGFFSAGLLRLLPSAWWLLAAGVVALWVWGCALALGRCHKASPRKSGFWGGVGAVFTFPAKALLRAAHLSAEESVTEEDVLNLMDDAEEQDMIDETQKEMISNIFELDDVVAGEIMTHRTEIASVSSDTPASEVIRISTENGYSRMPVTGKSVDDIIGILSVKDLFAVIENPTRTASPAREFMRPVMFVPESCRARDLLIEFKKKHTQMAVVVDEYGGTGGLVTMEDVLEEIVGNIQDEFDDEEEELVCHPDGTVDAAGNVDLEDVFSAFDKKPPEELEDEDFDSVSGMMIDRLGHIPDAGENANVEYGGLLFTVTQTGERRIDRVLVTPVAAEEKEEEK